MGAAVICPHTNTSFLGGAISKDDFKIWLKGDLVILRRCDALFAMDGWATSKGTQEELALCIKLEKPVFYTLEKLKDWLDDS